MNNEHIDKIFKASLKYKEVAPPASAWEKLDKSLKENTQINYYRYAAAIAFLIITTFYLVYKQVGTAYMANEKPQIARIEIQPPQHLQPTLFNNHTINISKEAIASITSKNALNSGEKGNSKNSLMPSLTKKGTESIAQREGISTTNNGKNSGVRKMGKHTDNQWALASEATLEKKEARNKLENDETITASIKEDMALGAKEAKPATITITYLRGAPELDNIAESKTTPTDPILVSAQLAHGDNKLIKLFKSAKEIKEGDLSLVNIRNIKNDILNMKIKL